LLKCDLTNSFNSSFQDSVRSQFSENQKELVLSTNHESISFQGKEMACLVAVYLSIDNWQFAIGLEAICPCVPRPK
jgi:hypothetical protein